MTENRKPKTQNATPAPVPRPPSSYAAAGVDIDAGNQAVSLMKDAVKATHGPDVLSEVGQFGGLFSTASFAGMSEPVLVGTMDGVGTKVMIAAQIGQYRTIGHDIVNHCIDDILVQGARPLFFLDYVASSKLDPEMIAEIVTGMAEACTEAGCALLGGETAEMPGVYEKGHFDVVGNLVGVVDRSKVLPLPTIKPGDKVIGLASSGPHTNGYSLIRHIFKSVAPDHIFPELGIPLAAALLAPHRNYYPLLKGVLATVKGLAHITGGGFIENLPRILPEGMGYHIDKGSWPAAPLWHLIQTFGEVEETEMYRVFNMGIGMVAVVAPEDVAQVQAAIPEETWVIGEITNEVGVTIA